MRRYPSLLLAVLLFPAMMLAQAEGAAAATSSPPLPPPGRMIDLGGWRLHLNCTGEAKASQPTVILEAGAGGLSVDWSLVQPEVARFARVCSYDRAGTAWSDLGPRPRTHRQIVWELHTLLEKAGERPPFVLVGHSLGGVLARAYALTYPSEVAGIVFSDSGHERGTAVFRDGKMVRLVDTATGQPIPPVKTSGPLRESDIPPAIMKLIEDAARGGSKRANDPPRNKLPADAQRMRAWALAQVKHYAANDNPSAGEELAALLDGWTKKEYALGDMPVIVLSRGASGADAGVEEEHTRNQAELLTLSRKARQVIARRSGHQILMDEPELVVNAIRDVLAAARR